MPKIIEVNKPIIYHLRTEDYDPSGYSLSTFILDNINETMTDLHSDELFDHIHFEYDYTTYVQDEPDASDEIPDIYYDAVKYMMDRTTVILDVLNVMMGSFSLDDKDSITVLLHYTLTSEYVLMLEFEFQNDIIETPTEETNV